MQQEKDKIFLLSIRMLFKHACLPRKRSVYKTFRAKIHIQRNMRLSNGIIIYVSSNRQPLSSSTKHFAVQQPTRDVQHNEHCLTFIGTEDY